MPHPLPHLDLKQIPAWHIDAKGLSVARSLKFDSFTRAFAFMTEMALIAEKMDHHPDWHNVYDHVSISLSTHDQGGLTAKDLTLALAIDAMLPRYQATAVKE